MGCDLIDYQIAIGLGPNNSLPSLPPGFGFRSIFLVVFITGKIGSKLQPGRNPS